MTLKTYRINDFDVEVEVPDPQYFPPQSTIDLAEKLDITAGDTVLELGCGCGILSICAAKMGACRVVATDIDTTALAAAKGNAQRNAMADRIDLCLGSWFDPLATGLRQGFDVIIATPPQTPGPVDFGPKYGGRDGTNHLISIIEQVSVFLKPGTGRLWLVVISLADCNKVLKKLRQCFSRVDIVSDTDRLFTAEEYNAYHRGLFGYLQNMREEGRSGFEACKKGYVFKNLMIRAK